MAVVLRRAPRALPAAVFAIVLGSAGVFGRIAGAADTGPPASCSGDEQCRAVNAACAAKFRLNDCTDLKLSPGIVLSAQEQCYVDAARRRCSQFDRALAQCLLHGHPGIAGGCWHLSPGFPHDTVEMDGRRYYCEVFTFPSDGCRQPRAGGPR